MSKSFAKLFESVALCEGQIYKVKIADFMKQPFQKWIADNLGDTDKKGSQTLYMNKAGKNVFSYDTKTEKLLIIQNGLKIEQLYEYGMGKAKGKMNEAMDVSKGIYSRDGKKVNLEKKGYLSLDFQDEDGGLTSATWKKWKTSSLHDTSSDYIRTAFVSALVATLSSFRDKVDYNSWKKRRGRDASFEQDVDYLLSLGAKIPKNGLQY